MREGLPEADVPSTGEGGLLPRMSGSQVTARTVFVVIMTTLIILGGLYLLWQLQVIARWLLIAVFLTVALDPAVDWLDRHRIKRVAAILLVYLALILMLVAFGALVVPPLVEQVQELVQFITNLTRRPGGPEQGLRDLAERVGLGAYFDTLREQASTLPTRLGGAVGPLLSFTVGIVTSITATISILLMTFFLLLDGRRFVEAGLRLFSMAQRPRLRRVLDQSADAVHGYISGSLTLALIAGMTSFIVLTILRVPYSVVLALIVALLTPIPLIGGTLGAVAVVGVTLFVDPVKAIIFLGFYIVYQQIENNVLQPVIFGRSVRLHPLAIFIAVLCGAQLLGILGALLAIPTAEIIRIIGAEWIATRVRQTGGEVHGVHSDAPNDEVVEDATGPDAKQDHAPTAVSAATGKASSDS